MEQRKPAFDTFNAFNARDILTVLFKHKYVILGTFLVVSLLATVVALQILPVYEAKTLLLIKIGREFYQRPDGPSEGSSVGLESIMNSEINILTGQELMSKVIDNVGLRNLYPDIGTAGTGALTTEQAAMKRFANDLQVTSLSPSTLIQISFTHWDAQVAARVVNTAAELFRDKHLEVFSGKSSPFLEEQAKTFRDRLSDSEKNLAQFKDRNSVFSFDEQKSALINQRSEFDGALKKVRSAIDELRQRISVIYSPKWIPEVPRGVKTQLENLQQRERDLLEKYNESSEPLRAVREQIRNIGNSMTQEMEQTRQQDLAKAEGELTVLQARAESISRQIRGIDADIRSLDSRGREFQALKRGVAEEEQTYQAYSKKLQESLIMDDMERRKMVAITVVEKPIPSSLLPKRQKLGKRKTVAAGVLGGLTAGICFAFLLEFLSGGLTTPLAAENRLGVPVMVAIARK